jgi:N-formylglutamate deformylase
MQTYSLDEIRHRLEARAFPFRGISTLGTTEFHFTAPSRYIGVTLHAGINVRSGLLNVMEVSPGDRCREEDPYTDRFIEEFPLRIIARDSRFEYDLNWEMERSIYSAGEKKWGLTVWNRELTAEERALTFSKYREFHAILDLLVDEMVQQGAPVILFDMHAFCFQREGRICWFEDDKPEINLGTRYVNRRLFSTLINVFLEGLSGKKIDNHPVRLGENELFSGGYLARKFSEKYNHQVLVMAIEFKKIFMDEWTGELYRDTFQILKNNFLCAKEQMLKLLCEIF